MKGDKELPAHLSPEEYKKQAKDLMKSWKSGDPETIRRIKQDQARLGNLSAPELQSARFSLADARVTIAREHGFESWSKFAKHIEALTRKNSTVSRFESAVNASSRVTLPRSRDCFARIRH